MIRLLRLLLTPVGARSPAEELQSSPRRLETNGSDHARSTGLPIGVPSL